MGNTKKLGIVAGGIVAVFVIMFVATTANAQNGSGGSKYAGLTEKQINVVKAYRESCEYDNQFVPSRARDCDVEEARNIQQFLNMNEGK